MKYKNIKQAKFLSRPNRFVANIEIDGKLNICHVKNTGRCKELLIPGATIFVEKFDNTKRSTNYDLIAVYKEECLINMDSQIPNKVFREWIEQGNLFEDISYIKSESTYGNSRLDFYIETQGGRKIFVEVKGVTLEENGVALFPDAPTERGIKHLKELCKCMQDGYEAYMVFIIQMKGVKYFTPNDRTHKAFSDELKISQKQGMKLLAIDCNVTADSITADNLVELVL